VAVGESRNRSRGYEWAIVSAGAPNVPTVRGKCRTGDFIETPLSGMKGDGLWVFTRNPIDPASTTAALSAAGALGFDVRDLKPVMQRGCLYDAPPKATPPVPARALVGKAQAESGSLSAGPRPAITRRVYFDLEQGGVDLGRVVFGL
jgi:hypothetical protein